MFTPLRNYLSNLESALFYRYLLVVLGACVVLSAGLFYWHQHTMENLAQITQDINSAREQVKDLLSQDERVNKQRKQVNALLKKEPEFKIRGYFTNLIDKLGLKPALKTPPETTSIEQEGEHTEVVLTASLSALSMQQLVALLQEIEKYERIYPKSIDVIKSSKTPTIDVNLVVATLLLKTE